MTPTNLVLLVAAAVLIAAAVATWIMTGRWLERHDPPR